MYVTTVARSLGAAPIGPLPPVHERCGKMWKSYRASHPEQHAWRAFHAAHPKCVGRHSSPIVPMPPVSMAGLGTVNACADAGTGLLIDCWQQAKHRSLGLALDQSQLAKVATAYQRMTRPNSLAGWVFNGRKMVWQGGGLGQGENPPDFQTPITPPDSYVTPPDPLTIDQWGGVKPAPLPTSVYKFQPVLPSVTAQTLFAAAQLPNAPAIVKSAASQLATQQATTAGSLNMGWFSQQMIAGVPNWGLVAGGVLLLLLVAKRRR